MKKYRIYSRDLLIGESDLEFRGEAQMGIYSGHMIATSGYEAVRHVFRMYCNALDLSGDERERQLERYYRTRDDLELAIVARDGHRPSVNWVHVVDLEDNVDELTLELSSTEPLVDER